MIQQYEAVSLTEKSILNNSLKLVLKVVKSGTTESKEAFEKAFVSGRYKEKEVVIERKERTPKESGLYQVECVEDLWNHYTKGKNYPCYIRYAEGLMVEVTFKEDDNLRRLDNKITPPYWKYFKF